ncbi:MAG: phosphatidylserine decarboxylase family protein [Nitrospinota bacterium]|nr:phosphatidylserine decarboxylase family protein [Nitrospinota bacterium]
MRIPLARESFAFITPRGILSVLLWIGELTFAASVGTIMFLSVLCFFRDPERKIPAGEGIIVSPADGKIMEITTDEDPFLAKTYTRITIFLSVFNVHVNRAPIDGKIEKQRYDPGKMLAAFNPKASKENEQNTLLFRNGKAEILVKQITGLIARRIVCWANVGDNYALGQRFGLIQFGSRVDLFVPEGTQLAVKPGDHVKGAASIIGHLPETV